MRFSLIKFLLIGVAFIVPQAYAVDSVIEQNGDSYDLTYFFGTAKKDGGTLNMSGDHEVQVEFDLDNDANDLDTATFIFSIDQDRRGSLNISSLEIRGKGISAFSDTALVGDISGGGRIRPNGIFRIAFAGREVTLGGNVVDFHVVIRGRARAGQNGDINITANTAGDLDFTEVLAEEVTEIHNGDLGGSSVLFASTSTSLQWFLYLQASIGRGDDTVYEGGIGYGSNYNYLPGDCCGPVDFPSFRSKRNGKLVSERISFDESGWVIIELNPDLSLSRMKGNVNGRRVNYRWRRSRKK